MSLTGGRFEMRMGGNFEMRRSGNFGMRNRGNFKMPNTGNFDANTHHHIEKIDEWEKMVAACSKRQAATFFPAPSRGEVIDDKKAYAEGNNIYSVVQWSKTTRGGRQFSLFDSLSAANDCSSSYGLCG